MVDLSTSLNSPLYGSLPDTEANSAIFTRTHSVRHIFELPLGCAHAVVYGDVSLPRSIKIWSSAKATSLKNAIAFHPTRPMIDTFRKRSASGLTTEQLKRDALLELPRNFSAMLGATDSATNRNRPSTFDTKYEALQLLRAVCFGNFLTNLDKFFFALQAGFKFMMDPHMVKDEDETALDATKCPSTRTLRRAVKRLDTVSINLDRRLYRAIFLQDADGIISIHAYSDGSCTRGQLNHAYLETCVELRWCQFDQLPMKDPFDCLCICPFIFVSRSTFVVPQSVCYRTCSHRVSSEVNRLLIINGA